jgi:hypothetical protein
MKCTFFNEEGDLTLNESIHNHPSYKKILEDSIVTKEELLCQYEVVMKLFDKIESVCDEAQKNLIKDLIIEMNILNVVSKKYSLVTDGEIDFVQEN